MPRLRIPYNFEPRNYQEPVLDALDGGILRAVCVWHRRAGKDKVYLNYIAKKMIERVGIYYYFFPTYQQGKKILWDGIDRDGFKYMNHIPHEIRLKTREDEMKIVLKEEYGGSVFQIVGTDKIDSIMGTNPVGCVFSEYSLQNPAAWDLIRPILAENGGFAIFNFTPRGRNHAFILNDMAKHNPKWFYQCLTVDDTKRPDGSPVISEEMIQAERESGMAEEMIQQEYYCSFDAMLGLCFFGKGLARHNNTFPGVKGFLRKNKFHQQNDGVLEIWRYPYQLLTDWNGNTWNKRYVIGSDIGEGLKQDYSVAYVFDRHYKEFVARMRSNKIDSDTWGDMLLELSEYYDNALLVPERNGSGITVCKKLADENANVYSKEIPAKVGGGMTKVVGWTENKESKYDLCGDLKTYYLTTTSMIYDAILLSESSTFIKTESGKLEADEGFYDDCVIAAGLALQGHYHLGDKATENIPEPTGWRYENRGKSAWAA